MNYYGNRYNEQYIYKRVSFDNFMEHEEYPWITDGNLEFSEEAELKVTGSLNFEGPQLPSTKDLMRVYYSFTDDAGEKATLPLATLFVGYNNVTHVAKGAVIKSKGTLNASSVLSVLQKDKTGTAYAVNKNSNIIYVAQEIVRAHGLNVDYTPSISVLDSDHTWQAGTNYLEIVNWLLQTAGYADAFPDNMGTVILKPLSEIQSVTPIIFKNDKNSIMYPEIEVENNIDETPNVVRLMYNVEDMCITATAKNLSGSSASLDIRGGRETTEYEDVGELSATTSKLTALIDMAEAKLRDISKDVEYVQYQHGYIPITLYQPITVDYSDFTWTGNVTVYTVELNPSAKVQTKIVRELTRNIEIEKNGEILRGE